MSRQALATLPLLLFLGSAASAQQPEEPTAETALQQARQAYGPPSGDPQPNCAEPETPGEIVVCARYEDPEQFRVPSDTDLGTNIDDPVPRAPDLGPPPCVPSFGTACIRFGKVPPPVHMVDFEALPETPPGSDADRIGRGLAPLGYEGEKARPVSGDAELAAESEAEAEARAAAEPDAPVITLPE